MGYPKNQNRALCSVGMLMVGCSSFAEAVGSISVVSVYVNSKRIVYEILCWLLIHLPGFVR
jgi:hypothetical protein